MSWAWPTATLLLVCLGLMVVHDAAANWALESNPGQALSWAPDDSRALAGAADDTLAAARTPADISRAEALARRALSAGPTQVDALRDLGLIAAIGNQNSDALSLLSIAAARSPLDAPSHVWMMKARLRTGAYAAGFEDADDLLRHDPRRLDVLSPTLMAFSGVGADALVARLATDPPWRGPFLATFAATSTDPAMMFAILKRLEKTSAKPTTAELTAYFSRRLADHAYQIAYLDWLTLLPDYALAKAGWIYDGNFEGLPGVAPFNWVLGSPAGGEAHIGRAPDGGPGGALHVRYDGVASVTLAKEMLVLPPGAYHLSGLTRSVSDGEAAENQAAWTVACADHQTLRLAPSAVSKWAAGWQGFSFSLVIPETGCEGQWLSLTLPPAETDRTIELWSRDLAIHAG